ncbi:MAG: hypothetical protein HY835_12595 [Anaerolineae bacterium]|nr:hypothetical protein [Anaerolineae bacterium]
MQPKRSGTPPFEFVHRKDLHALPDGVLANETRLHGGFAADRRPGYGQLYYGMPGSGILRIAPDLRAQELIDLPAALQPLNFHSTKIGEIGGEPRRFLPANEDALVAVVTLDGRLDFTLSKPEFEQYQSGEAKFAPTDALPVGGDLFVADGYGSNYITTADLSTRQWKGIFGGAAPVAEAQGKFSTAHGFNLHPTDHHHLVIADRPSSRLQVHGLDGAFRSSHALPPGSWPCGIDFIEWEGRWLGVIGSLLDGEKERPAPIFIVDAHSFAVLSTIRPKEELGVEAAQHLHNVVFHVAGGRLHLVCQSWNPGHYFVLGLV